MPDKRLKQFERSLKDKIEDLENVSRQIDEYHISKFGSNSMIALYCGVKVNGYREALNMLYEIYPELK